MKCSMYGFKIAVAELWPFLLAAFLLECFVQIVLVLVVAISSIIILHLLCRKRLNPFFVVIRLPWLPWNVIAQDTDRKAIREALRAGKSCTDIHDWLLHSMVTLFNDLPSGYQYCCRTHELVCKRLERWEGRRKIRIIVIKPCGERCLTHLLKQILGHKCPKCKNRCGWYQECGNETQFYYIKFYKLSERN